ncbi:DUF6228 family protein [Streptomyces sp. NPDC056190]|uniref:DUF6228 family protein n=1 Tax=unclassified Streptomyces TaxID=2593676 RepID=UPI0035D786BF
MPNGLARDFRGWEGERVRANNHLVVTASFRSGGHVHHVRHHAAWQPPGWADRSPARPYIRSSSTTTLGTARRRRPRPPVARQRSRTSVSRGGR